MRRTDDVRHVLLVPFYIFQSFEDDVDGFIQRCGCYEDVDSENSRKMVHIPIISGRCGTRT
jgi:hypothetical protein